MTQFIAPSLGSKAGVVGGVLEQPGDQLALPTIYTPAQLTFKMVSSQRAVDPWPSKEFVVMDEGFWNITHQDSRFQHNTDAGGGVYSATDGYASYAAGAGGWTVGLVPKIKTIAPYISVKARIVQLNGSVRVGIRSSAADVNNQVYLEYTGAAFNIVYTLAGVPTSTAVQAPPVAMPAAPFTLVFVMTWPEVWGWIVYDNGSMHALGFVNIGGAKDFRNIAEWGANWIPYLGFVVTANLASRVSNFGVGYPGAIGFRDMALVTYTDGVPYTRDGKYFFTATLPWGGADYRAERQGVFSFDPWSYRAQLVSQFFHEVGAQWTALYGSGCLMFDDVNDQWILITGGWGLGDSPHIGIDHYIVTSKRDLLQGVHRLKPTKLALPTDAATHSTFDGMARQDASGTWWFVYAESNQRLNWTARYPVLASGPSLSSLARVNDDSGGAGTQDGTRWFKLGGQWYIATGHDGGKIPRVYNALLQNAVDPNWTSDDTVVSGGMLNVASNHFSLIPVTDEGETRYLLLCYDQSLIFLGAGQAKSLGALVVWLADQTANGVSDGGHEFPRRRSRRA